MQGEGAKRPSPLAEKPLPLVGRGWGGGNVKHKCQIRAPTPALPHEGGGSKTRLRFGPVPCEEEEVSCTAADRVMHKAPPPCGEGLGRG